MSRERFQQAAAIFERAIGLEEPERGAMVERACGDDDGLRDEVLSLLAQHRPGEPGQLEAVHQSLLEDPEPLPPTPSPEFIGPYQVRRIIATGAMGTVYEAFQEDPHRVVALKTLRRDVTTPSMLRRFQLEAEFLGRLRHPNIAQIYDAATHDEGAGAQPYFAMEYVQGSTLTDHARAAQLGIRERIELLVKVCDAVRYAHGQGIIHRDLKPDNILVDEHGEPRILDFGIARATNADTRVTTLETGVGVLVGTIPYMSPEQVSAEGKPDARSDVYALGVLLYELLADRLPYDLRGKSIPEAVRIIQENEPSSLGTVNRELRGDVATIVAKALEKDPSRRYQSAADLVADLRHFLRDEAILARPASTFYKLRKLARRNPALVGGITASFVLLVAGILGTTWQLQATRDEVARFKELSEFVMDTFTMLSPAAVVDTFDPPSGDGSLPAVETLLVDAARRLETTFDRWPETRADLHLRLGLTFWGIGRFDDARSQLEHAFRIRKEHLGDEHVDTYGARMWLCQCKIRTGGPVFELAQEAIAIADGLQRLPQAPLRDVLAARLIAYNGQLISGHTEAALQGVRDVLAEAQESLPDDRLVFAAVRQLAYGYTQTGRHAEAELLLRPALERARDQLGDHDMHRRALAMRLAFSLNDQQRHEEALEFAQEAVDLGRIQAMPALTQTDMRATNALARALVGVERLDEAEDVLRQRAAECRELLGDHPYTLWAISQVGWALNTQQRYEEAVELLQQTLEGLSPPLADHVHTNTLHAEIARSFKKLDRFSEAEQHQRLAVAGADRHGQINAVLHQRRQLARLFEQQGKLEAAEQVWRERLTKAVQDYGGDRQAIGLARKDLAQFLYERALARGDHGELGEHSDLAEVESLAAEAAANLTATVGPGHADTVRARRQQALAMHRLGRSEEALRLLLHAVENAEREHGAQHWTTCWLRSARGLCLTDLQRFPEAEVELRAAYACRKATLEPGHPVIGTARENLVALYEAWGQPEQAALLCGE